MSSKAAGDKYGRSTFSDSLVAKKQNTSLGVHDAIGFPASALPINQSSKLNP